MKANGRFNYRIVIPLISLTILALMILVAHFLPRELSQPITNQSLTNLSLLSTLPTPGAKNPLISPGSTIVPTTKPQPSPKEEYTPQLSGRQLRVPILLYHYIGDNPNPLDTARYYLSVSPSIFEEQMRYLHDNDYHTISLDTLYPALNGQVTLPDKPIVLTFDDGYVDFYFNAYPILRKYGLHATVFIPTALMNQGYYLNWGQIRQMYASGLITFGAHTVNHAYLPALSPERVEFELSESKRVLQQELGVPINFLAYPYGAVNGTVIEATKKAGYLGAIGTWPSKFQSEGTLYNMPRLRVGGGVDLPYFISLL